MKKISSFDFENGTILSSKYKVIQRLGGGWEGEVYLVQEVDTRIERAAKFFYPKRNPKNKIVRNYAKKLHKLRACNSLVKYIAKDTLIIRHQEIVYLLSDFIEGPTLENYLTTSFSKKGMHYYQGLHLFYALVRAVEEIHIHKEWHGDLHSDNIIIQKTGLHYDLKLIDIFQNGYGRKGSILEDTIDLCGLLYEIIGGSRHYRAQPMIIKSICCGLKRTYIQRKFKNATQLRIFLEHALWE